MYFYPLCKMEHMIIDGTNICVDYNLEYERIIGDDVSNPKYRDIKFNVYVNDEHLSLFFWIDYTQIKQSQLLRELFMINLYRKKLLM